MPVTIKVNGAANSLVHKGSNGISMATIPDVCKTPSPAGPVPIPYPNISQSATLDKGTTTVKADGGMMIATKGSEFSLSNGDNAGVAGGVTSSTFMKESTWILYSFDVKMDGSNACRLTDKKFQNHENTADLAGEVQMGVATSEDDDDCDVEKCPHCGRNAHDTGRYPRSKSERRKALLRDAEDVDADLDEDARQFIRDHNGDNVPPEHEVSHEEPLYTKPKGERCKLDKADNMKTQPTAEHRQRHRSCGDQFHDFPR
jgi:Domain of unknown function (DUF4150)